MHNTVKITVSAGLTAALIFVLFACAGTHSMASKHPIELETKPVCSDCHSDWKTSVDHRSDFIAKHKFIAARQRQVCSVCHAEAFCSDCHAHKEEIKPSDKFKDAPERTMPHRGDYLNQHKIDGKINPASCFPCHGRQNNEQCQRCHR